MTIPTLTTDRLTLRAPEERDFDVFAGFYASERSAFVGGPLDRDRAWRQLATETGHWALRGYGRWSVEETATGALAGMVGLWDPEGWPEAEIGWDLYEGFEGRGYATEAAEAARAYAYDVLGWSTAISLVAPGNTASAAVATRLGAVKEGAIDHPRLGHLHVYRHPGPDALADGRQEGRA
ncbi:acetyltransferase, GNAT family protein [Pseudooceanicola batsensis HTCC2597]|uniref:Acetyltransferase, GNAT family protein n=1 Tax=Pseudooceanicola batsensis (strain ATCC BAA-863 / DSM 15984 / KCTC 12145 / HTCC2597) TaxID=252305 RepID=A3TY73_PSEBH|nr:GNAT family N-acetyltransferase [Pseudooceanicola batsensis]EAQ03107.1 acetyltransferase, GNAT family protein [Pseudooceanicola batsensis HTCC2597]